MKRRKMKTAAALALSLAVCAFVPAGITASANSALLYWRGSYAAGSAVLDENCPVQVESELLTFNISEFPEDFYGDTEDDINKFLSYGGRVTANYNFYNPAGYDVNMRLAFPYGNTPDYAYFPDGTDDAGKYSVTADGERVEACLRHTFSRGDFDRETDVGRLVDGFKEDDFYAADLPVYKYSFHVSGITYTDNYSVHAEIAIRQDGGRKIISTANGYESGKSYKISWFVRNGDDIVLYSAGKPLDGDEFNFRFYYYGRFGNKKTVDGRAERNPEKEETISFRQLALAFRGENSVVSESDWYNAAVDALIADDYGDGCLNYNCLNLTYNLMRWYEYSLFIPAGGRLVNEVTAPLYPAIDGYWSPEVYRYEYLLSPAGSWAAFGRLEVRVNTPFYMVEDDFGFQRAEYGYYYEGNGLPDREINFALCESEKPSKVSHGSGMALILIGVYILFICAVISGIRLIVAGLALTVIFIVKKVKSKRR